MNSKIKIISLPYDWIIRIGLVTSSFAIPFFLGQPQMVVGPLVNAMLILSAIYISDNLAWFVLAMPSVAILARGLIFGPFTLYLLKMLPIIWLGNLCLFLCYRVFYKKQKVNYFLTLFIGSFSKYLLLYGLTFSLVSIKLVPKIFLTSFGIYQFMTAMIGGLIAYLIIRKVSERK